jgi:hypothetical protein
VTTPPGWLALALGVWGIVVMVIGTSTTAGWIS